MSEPTIRDAEVHATSARDLLRLVDGRDALDQTRIEAAKLCLDRLLASLAAPPDQTPEQPDARAALNARRSHQARIREAAHRLYERFGRDDGDVMAVWSLSVIDPEPLTPSEIAHAQQIAAGLPVEAAPVPQGDFDYEQLDAGVREVVRRLRDAGFETTDSGDGVSKPEEWYESGEAMRVPNVAAVVAPQRLLAESQRFAAVLGDGWHVEATYFPQSGTAVLLGTGNRPVLQGERAPEREK